MARVPEAEIERLKREVDLAEVIARHGVELKKAGSDLVGRCPFHDDDTPSLVVTPSKGLWHCMGACHAGGSVIDWFMRTEGVSFRHAVEFLRAVDTAEMRPITSRPPARSRTRRLSAPVDADAEDDALLAQVVDYYHSTLQSEPEALRYLQRRRIDDPIAIERFRLGFSNRTLGLRLATKETVGGAGIRARLERLGIYRASGHEHLVGSITIPVADAGGKITELYGRKIGGHLKAGTPLHLYLPGPHAGVWNPEAMQISTEIILTESLIDALTFYCAGFTNVTASYGTAGFTNDHREAFAANSVSRILIAYDHDNAGDIAAAAVATELSARGIECFRVLCPLGADVNDVAMAADDPREALGALIRSAAWMGRGPGSPKGELRNTHRSDRDQALSPVASSSSLESAPSSAAVAAAPPASPVPPVPGTPLVLNRDDELVLETSDRLYRVRHIPAGGQSSILKVSLMVRSGERFHIDVLDLYSAKQRQGFAAAAASELHSDADLIRGEIGRVLLAVEEAQAVADAKSAQPATPVMSSKDREAALALLSDPQLTDRVTEAFSALGVVGESDASLATWLVLVSRLAERPLGAVIQSSSAAGKSTLAEAALSLLPTETKVAYSAMTGQALYYLGENDLSHKVLAIAETEGADRASYALKLLVSEGKLSIASAGKDPLSGRLVTNTYEVTGPVALLMTTTAAELEPELANRLVVLAVDETRSQTRAVQDSQRRSETLQGLVDRVQRDETIALHHNIQRLLSPVAVVNPHAPGLNFSDSATRHRRDNAKLLGLIRAVALAHQHQREKKTVEVAGRTVAYIEASEQDVALASRLADRIMPSTTDEMAPSTRRLLSAVSAYVAGKPEKSFTRRELRESTGLSDTQLKVHLARLVDLEYLSCSRAGPSTTYEMAAYGSYRPVSESDRPVDSGDRPVIGRFPGAAEKAGTSWENGEDEELSAGIGRSGPESHEPPSARENGRIAAYRPVKGKLRVLGEVGNDGVVVVEGSR